MVVTFSARIVLDCSGQCDVKFQMVVTFQHVSLLILACQVPDGRDAPARVAVGCSGLRCQVLANVTVDPGRMVLLRIFPQG